MTDNELRKLSRAELLEMLIAKMKENSELRRQLAEARFTAEKAGTLAEASLMVSGVFEAADKAARQYLESIENAQKRQMEISGGIINDAYSQADEIVADARRRASAILAKARAESGRTAPRPRMDPGIAPARPREVS